MTRAEDALTFTTTPTDVMRFLATDDQDSPDIYVERMAPGDGPPCTATRGSHGRW